MTTLTAIDQLHTIIPLLNKEGDTWDKMLDAVWILWSDDSSYNEFLAKVENQYGPLAKMAVMLAKYNYQVENGGHDQYFDNGYASRNSDGCFDKHEEIELHEELIKLVKQHLDIPLKSDLLKIMNDFYVDFDATDDCEDCGGTGSHEEEEEDEYGGITISTETCWSCNGTGEISACDARVVCSNALDNQYYKINEEVLKQIDQFFTKIINYVS